MVASTQPTSHVGQPAQDESVDVLIVGSGPVGAVYARVLSERLPGVRILMVDRGVRLSERPGTNLKNFLSNGALAAAAPGTTTEAIATVPAQSLARSGTELIDPRGPRPGHMPAAAVSTNVGGMGAHWSCATPAPADDERIEFIEPAEWEQLLSVAAELLRSSTRAFGGSARGAAMIEALGAQFDGQLGRPVQVMPHACEPQPDGPLSWTGSDTVLGPLLDTHRDISVGDISVGDTAVGFELREATMGRRVLMRDGVAIGVELEDLATGRRWPVAARAVVLACDSLRTPQLLWASGIRPAALGHYLNEHPMVGATVLLDDRTIERAAEILRPARSAAEPRPGDDEYFGDDPLAAVWVPYDGQLHRFSGQIASSPGSPAGFAVPGLEGAPKSRIVSLTWFCPKQPSHDCWIEFLDELGEDGLPIPDIHYHLTPQDELVVAEAIELTRRAGESFGEFVAGEHPKLLADGQSLHYMGTMRMGLADDGRSVCDPFSQVWGTSGLYVAGNGVIPTATACNPTLTSAALAVRGAQHLADQLGGPSS